MNLLYISAIMFATTSVFATPPSWQIIPEKSRLQFTATQNNAPVSGTFSKFSGVIVFAPEQLSGSKVKITVDMSSVETEYQDLEDTLKTADWFNIVQFPSAIFESTDIKNVQGKSYTADGNLTIRNKSIPAKLTFDLIQYDLASAQVEGNVTINRLDFGVGQNEWQKTDEVQNPVTVNFKITAIPESLKN